MDTEALRWFQHVADGVTVTEVSELERTSQSGVSRALARLEAEVGTPLLRRSGRTLRMTHAGVAFKHHVDAMMHQLDDGLAAVQQLIDPETGTVTLAFQPSLGTWLVPDLVSSFHADHPHVRFELRPKRNEMVTTVRARDDVDVELSTLRPPRSGFGWRTLAREPLRLVVPTGHPLTATSRVTLDQVAGLAFITLRPTSQLRHLCDDICTRAGFTPTIAFECEDLPTMRGYVAAGLGVAIMPALWGTTTEPASGQLHYLQITDADAVRDIGIAWSTERRLLPAAELFRKHVIDRATAGLLPGLATPD
jgi:LysR family transcriptional regulator, transcription activator of glutamate synthase operon